MARVLAIGDLHLPFTHKKYLNFCKKQYRDWGCTKVVFMGDVVDNHAISYHENEFGHMSASDELKEAQRKIKAWVQAFPKADVCIGNHDCLPQRKAKTVGLPPQWIRDYAEVYQTPNYDWQLNHRIEGVRYTHGKKSGKNAALATATDGANCRSTVIGHTHAFGGVQFAASEDALVWGLNAGCGIDIRRYAFHYGKDFPNRPTLGCGIIEDGYYPYFVPMKM